MTAWDVLVGIAGPISRSLALCLEVWSLTRSALRFANPFLPFFHCGSSGVWLMHFPAQAKESPGQGIPRSVWWGQVLPAHGLNISPSPPTGYRFNLWWRGGRYHNISHKNESHTKSAAPGKECKACWFLFFPVAMPTQPCLKWDLFLSSADRKYVAWELI